MGKLIPLLQVQGEVKARLIDFAADDEVLIKLINRMTDVQLKQADERLKGSLCDFIDRLEGLKMEFAKFISGKQEQGGGMLIVNAAIDYIVEFCHSVPKKNDTDDEIDNAYQRLLSSEMHKVVTKTIMEVVQ